MAEAMAEVVRLQQVVTERMVAIVNVVAKEVAAAGMVSMHDKAAAIAAIAAMVGVV